MAAEIMELENTGKGLFYRRHVNKTTTQYLCERYHMHNTIRMWVLICLAMKPTVNCKGIKLKEI